MNVKVDDISSVKKQLSFEVPAGRVDEEIDSAYKELAKTAKVKGFRQGKVPRAVLERHYAASIESQVLERLVSDSYFKALKDEKILAVSGPEITDGGVLEKGKPYTFKAQVEVQPEVEAKDYLELPLKKETFKEDETLVGARLEEMRLGSAQLETTDRDEAQSGDTVLIDFEGFINGVPFENGAAQDHSLDLGSNTFIPGFEDQLVGMKVGEEGEIAVTFPLDYGKKDLAGQDATFKVKIKEIKEKVLPELNDEFAAQMGLASLDDLRARVKEAHESQERSRIEQEFRDQLVDLLIERNPLEVPESMVKSQLDYMLENLSNRMQSQGMSLEAMGMTPDSFKEVYQEIAVKQVKGNLLLEAIALQESIKVEETEIEEKLEEIAEKHNASKEMVMNFYSDESKRRGLVAQLAEEKVIHYLTGKANIEMVEESIAAEADQGNDKE
ncbi:trigger factor [Syntrophotalea acetylenivorans]|uniref:Trigger factor n=1 Tax=Syntrophotalea acetylenivorans TaxID=1842532 RepID=A0A1L3GLS6_9BACT|nr:trigger factor [Syntrophotalea acetylenivorans]APG26841.1 trigger factor [Syntrophotalea acetylenivorans]